MDKRQPNLWGNLLLERDIDFGGTNCLVLGRLGSGKTSLLVHIFKRLLEMQGEDDRPEEYLWWRGQKTCQWAKFDDILDYQIFAPEGMKIEFITEEGQKNVDVQRYTNYTDLLDKGELGQVNVVYFDTGNLINFIEKTQERSFEWHSFGCDEADNIAPWPASGDAHDRAMKAADIVKETRKNKTSFYANTQGWGSLHWALKYKFMSKIFLVGAPKPKDAPVWKSAIRGLELGQGWLTSGGQFQKISFDPYPTQEDVKALYDGSAEEVGEIPKSTEEGVAS